MADEKIVADDEEKVIEKDKPESEEKKGKETETEEEETEEIKEDEFDVPVREATLQHIIARKNKQIDKLKEKKDEEEETEKEEEELTPEADRALERKLDERFAPFREREISLESDRLLSKLYEDESEAKPYDKVIRKFINYTDPKTGVKPYEHIPPSVIYHHLAFGAAETTGAHKKESADLEAKLSRTRGRGTKPKGGRTESGLPHVEEMEEMSDEEFNRKIIGPSMQG